MTNHLPSIVDLLQENGPLLTSDISKMYRDMGLGESAARQRVSRRPEEVKSLYGLPFPKGARFLYLEGDFGDKRFFRSLIAKLSETKSSYSAAISGMIAREGICLKSQWDIVSGAPVLQRNHVASAEILRRLLQTKLIKEVPVAGIGECLILNERFYPTNFSAFRARCTIEHILREAVRRWAIRMGLSTSNVLEVSSSSYLPKFSTFCFDLVGPSYLNALATWKDKTPKPGFFVSDIIWNEDMREAEVDGFLKKVDTLKPLRGLSAFQPMLVAAGFTKDALMKCRSKGVITVTPDTLFGRDIAEALLELLTTLEKAAQIAIGNPEKIEALFDKLSGLDGNLRGAFFEMVVGHLVRQLFPGSIDIGVLVSDFEKRAKADIDVRLVNQTEVVCYECKGHAPHVPVTCEDAKYWLEKQVPTIRAAHNMEGRFQSLKPVFEFWTTSFFDADALAYLEKRKVAISKYRIEWRDGTYVHEQASALQNKTIKKVLDQYYFNHPMIKVVRQPRDKPTPKLNDQL